MRELTRVWKGVIGVLVGVWSFFLVYTALTVAFHPIVQGSISLGFGLVLVYLLYPLGKKGLSPEPASSLDNFLFGKKDSPALLDILLAILSITPCVYILFTWKEFCMHPGWYETYDLALAGLLAICLLEGTRRCLGKTIPFLVLVFIGYALFGQFIPGFFGHSGFSLEEVLYQLYLMTEGIWGFLTDITSRIIALFILFGPVLFATGVGKGFMDVAQFTGGRVRGGAGQIAVIGSASFGTLSGSSVANVATTGAFTIPTMKRLGYSKNLAGAIEASASSGGQIMPPIMGAGAFVMAEFLGIPYLHVIAAAIIPALIYYAGVASGVWIEATRQGLGKLPLELIPKAREVFAPRQVMTVLIPVGVLIYLLIQYLPPQLCAGWALIVAMVLFMLTGGRLSLKPAWERIKIIAGAYHRAVTAALAWLMVMMSCVQMAVSMIALTGFGVKLSEVIIGLAGVNVLLALIATMGCAIILGMGMTTSAAYVIAAAVLGPALIGLGIPGIAGHLFIFYFAIISAITPPVCIAAFTAASISRGSWLRIAFIAMRLCIAAYIVPYFFVFSPALLMQGEPLYILLCAVTALAAMFFIEAGAGGYFIKPTTILERLLLIAGGLALIQPGLVTDGIGLALIASAWFSQKVMPPIPVIGTRAASPSTSEGEKLNTIRK